MPLLIQRNDITKMKVDAIVNSTNELLLGMGDGVDGSIHVAAGEDLDRALERIGGCSEGCSVITGAFNIENCKYIIHTVAPYYDGTEKTDNILRSCYRSIFSLAEKNDCASIAVPVLSAGEHRYPGKLAYRIATEEARSYLKESVRDMMIYLVTFSRDIYDVGRQMDGDVDSYIGDDYQSPACIKEHHRPSNLHFGYAAQSPRPASHAYKYELEDIEDDFCFAEEAVNIRPEPLNYSHEDRSFGDMCQWWVDQKRISQRDFYVKANITKALFWSLKNHPEKMPKKTTALACVIGLELNMRQAEDLLERAGFTFSSYFKLDVIVKKYISKGDYNIDELNAELYNNDLPLLGSSM